MNVLMIMFALLGGSADKTFDPASMAINQIVKGVYDETRVETLEINKKNKQRAQASKRVASKR